MKVDIAPASLMPSSRICPVLLSLYFIRTLWSTGLYSWPSGA